jgi:voltage-gated potassium channel Kch
VANSTSVVGDIVKDKTLKGILIFLIFFFFGFVIVMAIIDSRKGRSFSILWGLYKREKVDTINKVQYDTVFKYIPSPLTKTTSNPKINNNGQTNVTSNNQSGGQTAKEITNNNK